MRFVKGFIVALVLIVLAFVSLAYVLPREVVIKRSIDINATAERIYPHVSSLKATQAWSPWLALDPDVALEYMGPDAGVGAKMRWESQHPNVGVGQQEVIEARPDEYVATALDFGDRGRAIASFTLQEQDGATAVTWALVSDAGYNPIARWMGLMLDRWVGADYERGLANLKALIETQ